MPLNFSRPINCCDMSQMFTTNEMLPVAPGCRMICSSELYVYMQHLYNSAPLVLPEHYMQRVVQIYTTTTYYNNNFTLSMPQLTVIRETSHAPLIGPHSKWVTGWGTMRGVYVLGIAVQYCVLCPPPCGRTSIVLWEKRRQRFIALLRCLREV